MLSIRENYCWNFFTLSYSCNHWDANPWPPSHSLVAFTPRLTRHLNLSASENSFLNLWSVGSLSYFWYFFHKWIWETSYICKTQQYVDSTYHIGFHLNHPHIVSLHHIAVHRTHTARLNIGNICSGTLQYHTNNNCVHCKNKRSCCNLLQPSHRRQSIPSTLNTYKPTECWVLFT